jgi:hypothetical protein
VSFRAAEIYSESKTSKIFTRINDRVDDLHYRQRLGHPRSVIAEYSNADDTPMFTSKIRGWKRAPALLDADCRATNPSARTLLARLFAVGFNQFGKLLVELVQFRRNHHLAIRLVRIIGVVLLVISFGFIEVGQRF